MAKSYLSLLALLSLANAPSFATAQTQIDVNDWVVPYPGPQKYVANVGDTIVFSWGGQIPHNVLIHPTMSCDTEGAQFIGAQTGSSYTFLETDGNDEGTDMFFACDVGGHCEAGQNLIVKVFNSGAVSGVADDAEMDMPVPEPAPDTTAEESMDETKEETTDETKEETMEENTVETEVAEAEEDSAGTKLQGSFGAFAAATSIIGVFNLF